MKTTKILKNRGVIFNDNDCQLGCQLLSMREMLFGLNKRRVAGNPKQKEFGG